MIGKHRYNHLKQHPEKQDAEDKILMQQYEKAFAKNEAVVNYNPWAEVQKPVFNYSSEQVLGAFLKKFKELYLTDFNEENLPYISTVIHYFTKDERFFTSKGLRADISKPSFNKGLLLIGICGNGKTSTMKVLNKLLAPFEDKKFNYTEAEELIWEFEAIDSKKHDERKRFIEKISKTPRCFNDLKTERLAYNYGKINLLSEIMKNRSEYPELITHATCNYNEPCICKLTRCICGGDYQENAVNGLIEFQFKYSQQIYSRLFQMFNVIEFGNQSFRI